MDAVRLRRPIVGALVAMTMLAGCGGTQNAMQVSHGTSWMLPEAKSADLLYVGDLYHNVDVFSYPAGKLVGTLAIGGVADECSDKNGNVFIAQTYGAAPGVYEYAHGAAQPTNYFAVPEAFDCSVDAATGNLAVIPLGDNTVYIYQDAQGAPAQYSVSSSSFFSGIAYDDSGNLFLNGSFKQGETYYDNVDLVELRYGSDAFQLISVGDNSISDPQFQPILWDGKYLDIASRGDHGTIAAIDRLKIAGTHADVARVVKLRRQRKSYYPQFYIQGNSIIQGLDERHSSSSVDIFMFPQGTLKKKFKVPNVGSAWGLALSVAPSRTRTR